MNYLKQLEIKQIKLNYINKFNYQKINEIPKIENVTLSFGGRNNDMKSIATSLLALEVLTTRKGTFTRASKPNISLKIRKGHPVGCSLKLRNNNIYLFMGKLINEILPYTEKEIQIINIKTTNQYSLKLKNTLNFELLKENYIVFRSLYDLRMTITTSTSNKKELIFLLKSFNII